ncbi:Lysophospholipase L2 [Alphaproteobacteria bacterium SO-S41]|nr:Lysophospholipase L2 [Alphaproteobacteria bacterium SO-S41]
MKLVETPDNPSPPGAVLHEVTATDDVKLRAAVWQPTGATPRGTIVVLSGRTEFIEKYFEFIGEILARGYGVVCFDWRGQGLSQRLTEDRTKGHVGKFADYDLDLEAVMAQLVRDVMPKPHILFGHSLGGHLALRHLAKHPDDFERAFLSAPMLKIWMPTLLWAISGPLTTAMCWAGRGGAFTPGGEGNDGVETPFEENRVTTDRGRYARNNNILKAEPLLALCGPTWHWIREAFASMRMLRKYSFAAKIKCRLMIVGAAHDRIVNQGPDVTLIRNVKRGLFVLFSDAEHELVQERDEVRAIFWNAADAFLAGADPD